jgi:hypothetical protein
MNGINKLLELAAKDAGFADILLLNRQAALAQGRVRLSETEMEVLHSVDDRTLRLMIESVKQAPRRPLQQSPGLITGISPDRPRARGISPDRPGPPVDPWKPPRREHF